MLLEEDHKLFSNTSFGGVDLLFPLTSVRCLHCLSSEARWLSAAFNQARLQQHNSVDENNSD